MVRVVVVCVCGYCIGAVNCAPLCVIVEYPFTHVVLECKKMVSCDFVARGAIFKTYTGQLVSIQAYTFLHNWSTYKHIHSSTIGQHTSIYIPPPQRSEAALLIAILPKVTLFAIKKWKQLNLILSEKKTANNICKLKEVG